MQDSSQKSSKLLGLSLIIIALVMVSAGISSGIDLFKQASQATREKREKQEKEAKLKSITPKSKDSLNAK